MLDLSLERREFLKLLSTGSAALGLGISAPEVIGKTSNGNVVFSPSEYGSLPVEIRDPQDLPYTYDAAVLKPMSEKLNTFSRNVWVPERRKALAEA